jgi:hypothetical protein
MSTHLSRRTDPVAPVTAALWRAVLSDLARVLAELDDHGCHWAASESGETVASMAGRLLGLPEGQPHSRRSLLAVLAAGGGVTELRGRAGDMVARIAAASADVARIELTARLYLEARERARAV